MVASKYNEITPSESQLLQPGNCNNDTKCFFNLNVYFEAGW